MFHNSPFPWVLLAIGVFAAVPNPVTLVLVVFSFLHYLMGSMRNGR